MRKHLFFLLLFSILLMVIPALAQASSAQAEPNPPVDWAWLVAQVESGAETVTLPNSIAWDGGPGLSPVKSVKIIGNFHSLAGAQVDQGTVLFEDVILEGVSGFGEEDGGAALTLRGTGTVVVLSGVSRAMGGASGAEGMCGGDGIVLMEEARGVIVRNGASVTGGVGRLFGGAGIRVLGCNGSVLATDGAIIAGSAGTAKGGGGIEAPACCKITLTENVSVSGGQSSYNGGDGVSSRACPACDVRAQVLLSGYAAVTGGVGETGGAALRVIRAGEDVAQRVDEGAADVVLSGRCMLLGAAGGTAGPALEAEGCVILLDGNPAFTGGFYYVQETPVLSLTDCAVMGSFDDAAQQEGVKTDSYPARNVSQVIQGAISKQSDRSTPAAVENGLNTRALSTRLDGLSVERGKVSQAGVNGAGLLITMWDGTLETKLRFQQYLMPDGFGGVRFVCVATTSQVWPTLRSSVAALNKLKKEGITQLAYTCAEPVYNERIIELHALLEAIEANEEPVKYVYLGTADDAVIFVMEDEKQNEYLAYQEGLMGRIARPLEEADGGRGE